VSSGKSGLISQLDHLVWLGENVANSSGKYYTMTANIDASSSAGWNDAGTDTTVMEGFKPIGTPYYEFDGTFEGNGHTITGVCINRQTTNSVGLFVNVV
jgi:hypothetical protein